jgi:hypothetical protein
MKSSGIRRGLAVSAVSALALAGLATAPAHASTIDDRLDSGDTVVFYTPHQNFIVSKKNDGVNSTFTLLAGAPKAVGATTVNAIRFTAPSAPPLNVTVPVTAGVAEYQWDVPLAAGIVVTATAVDAANNPIGTPDTQTVSAAAADVNPSVSVDGALRDKKGYYTIGASNFAALTGKQNGGGSGNAAAINPTTGAGGPGTATTVSGPVVGGINPWGAVVDVPTAFLDVDVADDDVALTDVGPQDEDGNVFSLYKQTVAGTDVTIPLAPGYSSNVAGDLNGANPAQPSGGAPDAVAGNDISQYLLTIKDQFGKPVAGVPTFEANAAGNPVDGNLRDATNAPVNGTVAVATDWDGTRRVTLSELDMDNAQDLDLAPNVQSTWIVVDLNGDGVFQNAGDILLKISQTNVPAAPASITLVNKLPGTAPTVANATVQDDDECGDVIVTVKDANGNPVQNVTPTITVTKTTNGGTPVVTHPAVTGPTNPAGQTHVVGCLSGTNNAQTTIKVEATTINGSAATPLVVESDESDVIWDEGSIDQALHGTSVTEGAALELPSGAGLPGRTVGLVFGHPGANNASFAPQAEQPAGIITGTPFTATATTGVDGKFGIKVTDPALPNGEELGDTITATAPSLSSAFDVINSVLTIDFLRSLTPSRVEIHNPTTSDQTDGLPGLLSATPMPGGLAAAEVVSFNSDDRQLDDVNINMTIDQGSFLNLDNPFEGTPAVGGLLDFRSAGQSAVVSTDDGVGFMIVNIKRNAGFDDDGRVSDKLHATAGSATDDHDFTWSTNQIPLNQGSFGVALSADQQSSILPKARAGTGDSAQDVFYDVKTTDQFGNRTSQNINVTDNTPVAGFGTSGQSEFDLTNPAIDAFSPAAANQALEVELNGAQKTTYTDDPGDSSFDPANPFLFFASVPQDIQTTTAPINWYTVNLNDPSLYTLEQQGSETVPVGSTVSYTLTAIDPEGQPINGSGVGFLRVGPGDQGQDDDGQATDFTNEDGEAFYDFAGSVPGTASVSAVIYDDAPGGGAYHRLFVVGPDTVTFGSAVVPITPKLTGENAGNKDVLTVNAKKAAGASVKLYKKTASGKVLLKTSQLNVNGIKSFKIKDNNPNKKTKYVAVVSNTPRTQRGVSNTVNLK